MAESKRRGTASERLRAWAKANPEKAKESAKKSIAKWRKKNPDKVKEGNAEQYRKNRERDIKRKQKWYAKNTERGRESGRRWARNNKEKLRALRIKKDYGISVEEYNSLIVGAGTLCPICRKSFGEIPPCIDHDHSTGKIRGVICRRCNLGIGLFKESIDAFLNAVEYLRKGK